MKRLGDDHADVRVEVLGALGALARNSNEPPPAELARCLDDKALTVRMAAVEALARFPCGLDRWIKDIFEVLERAPHTRIGDVTFTLLKVRPQPFSAPAISALIAALGSRHPSVRCCAAHLLGNLGPDAVTAVPVLIGAMSDPSDATKSGQGEFDDPSTSEPAIAAMDALCRIAPGTASSGGVVKALINVEKTGHRSSVDALGRFGPEAISAVPLLISVIKENVKPGADFWHGARAAFALAKIAPDSPAADEAIALLTEAVQMVSKDTREIAVNALAAYGPRAREPLCLPSVSCALSRFIHPFRRGEGHDRASERAIERGNRRVACLASPQRSIAPRSQSTARRPVSHDPVTTSPGTWPIPPTQGTAAHADPRPTACA